MDISDAKKSDTDTDKQLLSNRDGRLDLYWILLMLVIVLFVTFLHEPVRQIYTFFSPLRGKTLRRGYARSMAKTMSTIQCFSIKWRHFTFLLIM